MTAVKPTAEIAGCRAAQAELDRRLQGLTEVAIRRPSRLPDWSVAHVLAHIARNADSVVRRLRGCIEGEVRDQYAGGKPGRAAEIEQTAALPVGQLLADVHSSSARVEETIESMPSDAWERLSRSVGGELVPAHRVVYSRWREVEVHHVDLGLGYTPADWPAPLVEQWLPDLLARLPDRADHAALLAWAIGRAPVPELGPWVEPLSGCGAQPGGIRTAISPPSAHPGVSARSSPLQNRPGSYQFGRLPPGSNPIAS
jgi:maleylpyruvate isomerase